MIMTAKTRCSPPSAGNGSHPTTLLCKKYSNNNHHTDSESTGCDRIGRYQPQRPLRKSFLEYFQQTAVLGDIGPRTVPSLAARNRLQAATCRPTGGGLGPTRLVRDAVNQYRTRAKAILEPM